MSLRRVQHDSTQRDPAQANADEAVKSLFRNGGQRRLRRVGDEGGRDEGGVGVPVAAGPCPIRGGAEAAWPVQTQDGGIDCLL
ncbi:hypothetical protein [Deinococcus sp.]|uniref:hypothetical protein n=1 Tax=Deinococcus sp. TaxID=47478 RepID=UPI0025C356D9|nr:hypothetical protein [Deinococcus sp.]